MNIDSAVCSVSTTDIEQYKSRFKRENHPM